MLVVRRRGVTIRLVAIAPEMVRVALQAQRAAGVPFDEAWEISLRSENLDDEWVGALCETRPAWERAYHGEQPTPSERALVATALLPGEGEPIEDADDVVVAAAEACASCNAAIPEERRRHRARYCSKTCQRHRHWDRAAALAAAAPGRI